MSAFNWNDLLIDQQQVKGIAPDRLEIAAESASMRATTLAYGISSIGSLLASTASNGITGLDDDTATNLGFLLESLGGLTAALINTSEGMNDELSQRARTPTRPAKATPTKGK